MTIRPAVAADLPGIMEIDSVIESTHYFHVDQSAGVESASWQLQRRAFPQKLIEPHLLDDDVSFALRQIVSGGDDGLCLIAEHDEAPVASLLAQPADGEVLRVRDLRVDCAHRRQGIATVLLFQAIEHAKNEGLRAATIVTAINNAPAYAMLTKHDWNLSGIDTRRESNHDLVKEQASLIWYYETD